MPGAASGPSAGVWTWGSLCAIVLQLWGELLSVLVGWSLWQRPLWSRAMLPPGVNDGWWVNNAHVDASGFVHY